MVKVNEKSAKLSSNRAVSVRVLRDHELEAATGGLGQGSEFVAGMDWDSVVGGAATLKKF
jgi:hypothetical protein